MPFSASWPGEVVRIRLRVSGLMEGSAGGQAVVLWAWLRGWAGDGQQGPAGRCWEAGVTGVGRELCLQVTGS